MIVHDNELIVDNFAGGGGASMGLEMALGRPVDIAINHDPCAIAVHKANHPHTKHYCESVWEVDPIELCGGKTVGMAWFSPDCRYFSKALGKKPVNKKVRGLAWIVIKWCALVKVRQIRMENVEEIIHWCPVTTCPLTGEQYPDWSKKGQTYTAFIECLTTGLSLDTDQDIIDEIVEEIGDSVSLKTLYKGLGYDIDWKILKASSYGAPTIRKRWFLIGRNDNEKLTWPIPTHGNALGLKPEKTALDILDFSVPSTSIFNRKRPLAQNTLNRIAKGICRYVYEAKEPVTTNDGLTIPFITEHANASKQRNFAVDEPLRTICANVKGGHFGLIEIKLGELDAEQPPEVTAFLIEYYGNGQPFSVTKPLHTVTTKDRFALVTVKHQQKKIIDITMRMLTAKELFKAQSFPDSYVISHDFRGNKLTKVEQVRRCGNAVPPLLAAAVVAGESHNQVTN
jgi:site-specific DNA-cytosine methylase